MSGDVGLVHHFTDLGNADRLIISHGGDLLYSDLLKKWLIWSGSHWRIDDRREIYRRASRVIRSLYHEADRCEDPDRRQAIARHALKSEASARIEAMVSLARNSETIQVRPNELDGNPWLLTVRNGTLDLRTGELRPHDRNDLITHCLPVAYDSEARCPTWHRFIDEIFDANPRLVEFTRRAIGYSLTGITSEHCFFLLHGGGANGKTTLLETVAGLWGDYSVQTRAETLMMRRNDGIPNDVARLRGARLVVAGEGEEGHRLAEARIKDLTGGGSVEARFLHAEFFQFTPTFKVWLGTNHKPKIRGSDHAIWRRVRLVPFQVTFPPEKQDRELPEKLRGEWPGILTWAVQGCLAWQKYGLPPPEEVARATEEYRSEQDLVGAFLGECCFEDPAASALARDLYRGYIEWAKTSGERPLSQKDFGTRLAERGFTKGPAKGNVTKWTGVGLLARG